MHAFGEKLSGRHRLVGRKSGLHAGCAGCVLDGNTSPHGECRRASGLSGMLFMW